MEKNRDKDFVQNPEGIEFMARMALGRENEEVGVLTVSPTVQPNYERGSKHLGH